LHDLWSNYSHSTWHVIGRVYEKWGATWGQVQILGHGPYVPVETPLIMRDVH